MERFRQDDDGTWRARPSLEPVPSKRFHVCTLSYLFESEAERDAFLKMMVVPPWPLTHEIAGMMGVVAGDIELPAPDQETLRSLMRQHGIKVRGDE